MVQTKWNPYFVVSSLKSFRHTLDLEVFEPYEIAAHIIPSRKLTAKVASENQSLEDDKMTHDSISFWCAAYFPTFRGELLVSGRVPWQNLEIVPEFRPFRDSPLGFDHGSLHVVLTKGCQLSALKLYPTPVSTFMHLSCWNLTWHKLFEMMIFWILHWKFQVLMSYLEDLLFGVSDKQIDPKCTGFAEKHPY